jgi:hypothetical protein
VLAATGDANPYSDPLGIVQAEAEGATATRADGIGEVLGWVAISPAIAKQFGRDIGLSIAVPVLATLHQDHH